MGFGGRVAEVSVRVGWGGFDGLGVEFAAGGADGAAGVGVGTGGGVACSGVDFAFSLPFLFLPRFAMFADW